MAKKQGFQFKDDPFVYQELDSGVSMAIGLDDSDDDKLKVVTSTTAGASPSLGNENIIIDPSTNGDIEILPNGTGVITSDSNISLTSGAGITFDGTNVLNFYETGTWTPVITFGGASVGITYSLQEGHYTRIGNLVWASYRIVLTNKGSSTGEVRVSLPIAVGLSNGSVAALGCGNVTFTTSYLICRPIASTSTATLQAIRSANTSVNLADSNLANNTNIVSSVTYLTA